VRARLVERRPDYGRAEIVDLLVPGPHRRQPPCPYFVRCGGCDLQHLADEVQLELKAQAVEETLARLGGVRLERPAERVAGEPFGYRLRTQLQVRSTPEGTQVGYFMRRSHDLVAVDRCPILVPELEGLLPTLPGLLGPDSPRRLDLTVGDHGALSAAPLVEGLPHGEVSATVGDLVFTYDARCFFQAHRGLLPQLLSRVVGEWTGERAVDLYAGVGLFSLALARRYGSVTAVEGERLSARYAARNAKLNHLEVEVVAQAVESWASRLPADLDRVVVDPPRTGLALPVRDALLERPPRRLTYVSCHAAALARDLRDLGRGFTVESVALLDLFPQSGHLESVVQLVRS
jgi:23S rRNA (uracil1939-C5)-methyltransferase